MSVLLQINAFQKVKLSRYYQKFTEIFQFYSLSSRAFKSVCIEFQKNRA